MSQRFCVMTTGRTGSTWLMDTLAAFPDVAVPAKNVESPDNELLMAGMAAKYAALLGRTPADGDELVEMFFEHNAQSPFAGFKSMPNRHANFRQFVRRSDIRFITLDRRDVVATAASFFMARVKGTWRRSGGQPDQRVTFTPDDQASVVRNIEFIVLSKLQLASVRPAIRLTYEELCQPDFASAELDAFFARPVRPARPRGATQARDSIENWEEFADFVHSVWSEKLARVPPQLRRLILTTSG